jgi:c-di-GMP-related signal transduction protein
MTDNSITVTQEIFLGRQPILDRNNDIVAYELLFRSGYVNTANVTDDLFASAQVITHAFSDLGIEEVLGNNLGFINVNADLLISDMVELLPREKIVFELLETIKVDETIVKRCAELKDMGFQLALDDFTQFDAQYEPLKGIIDIIKIDLIGLGNGELEETTKRLKQWPAKLLAEKVDSLEQADLCRNLGYE